MFRRDMFKSIILHIFVFIFFALPMFKAVKREIVPSNPIPVIFEKIEKEASLAKKVAKLKKKKPASKPKPKVKKVAETEKIPDVKKIPDFLKPENVKEKKDFASLIEELKPLEESPPARGFDSVLKDLTPEEYKEEDEELVEIIPDSIMDKLKDNFTIAEENALRLQIMNNWLVPVGAKDIEYMEVDIKIRVLPGGVVSSTKVLKNRYYQKNNVAYEIFVQSAKRAVLKSSPLKLSQERMEIESDITFHFAPTDMF